MARDIGVFGYVGSSGIIYHCYFDNVTIDVTGLNASSQADGSHHTKVHDLNSDNILETCYVGYLAGHITKSAQFIDTYINNSTVLGGAGSTSSFGFFGCVETEDGSALEPIENEITALKTAGDDAGFGGSIDMYSLHSRLVNVYNTAQSSSLSKYVSAEQVDIYVTDTGTETYTTATGYTDTYSQYLTGYYFYDTPVNQDGSYGGSYNISQNSSNLDFQHIRLFSNSTYYPKTVTTYTHYDESIDAFKISSEGNYLTNADTSITSTTDKENGQAFVEDGDHHLFINIDGWKYYLNKNGETGLSLSKEAISTWTITNDTIYTTSNSKKYYLYYQNGWRLTSISEMWEITDGKGHYLGGNTTSVYNETNEVKARMWMINDSSSNQSSIYTIINDTNYYLTFQNETLSMSTSDNPTIWNLDNNGVYYKTAEDINYYVQYDNEKNEWHVTLTDYNVITDGTHYLSTNGTEVTNANSNSASVKWLFSKNEGEKTISCYVNDVCYYLGIDSSMNLVVSTSNAYTWTINEGTIYKTINGTDFYLLYNKNTNRWEASIPECLLVTDNNGHYLSTNGTSILSSDESGATRWQFSRSAQAATIAFTNNSNKYYLSHNGTTLTTSTTAYKWKYDTYGYYAEIDNNKWYISYENGWKLALYSWYYITDGTNYLTVNNTSVGNTTTKSSSVKWLVETNSSDSNQKAFYTYINMDRYYLKWSADTDALSMTTGTDYTYFYAANNSFYVIPISTDNKFALYLQYNSGWKMDIISGKYIKSGSNYLNATTSATSNTTNKTSAKIWQFSNYSATSTTTETTIFFYEKGAKHYLSFDGSSLKITDVSTNWHQTNTSFYIEVNNKTYYLTFNSIWTADGSKYITD